MPSLVNAERLQRVDSRLGQLARHICDRMPTRGISGDLAIVSGLRTNAEQRALFAQGRTLLPSGKVDLPTVNALRKAAGLWEIGEAEAARVVTQARPGESAHNHGAAIDIVLFDPLRPKDKRLVWDSDSFWQLVWDCCLEQKAEFVWGGDWNMNGRRDERFRDSPHIELKNWRDIAAGRAQIIQPT